MKNDYKIALEWDVPTWSRALAYWEKTIAAHPIPLAYGLEIGARNGGLSWYFAKNHGCKMVCTDFQPCTAQARTLHQSSGLAGQINYQEVDARSIPFPDNTFDFIVFKSLLGAVGREGQTDQIKMAVAEMHRVLKPNGYLFFAENLQGTLLHRLARHLFIPWNQHWNYLTTAEVEMLLTAFSKQKTLATGCLAAFTPRPYWLKQFAARLDQLFGFLPKKWCYVCYGYAVK